MNLAKISANGQITVPVEIRRLLGLKSGDKILFYQKQDGEVVLSNASAQAIRKAQSAFSGAAEAMGISSEEDVQTLVDEVRYGKGRWYADNHEIVLCDRNIAELRDILNRKAPKFLPDAEVLLAEMSYELIPAVDHAEKLIRDAKDQPILNAAIVSDVDIILTGDKDFLSVDMEHPKCMTVAQFFASEGVEE